MKEFWDSKYASEEYVYGDQPNDYLKQAIDKKILSGRIMFPAEGEGRNAAYAAKNGIEAIAFDQSSEAKVKAMRLAAIKGVDIEYLVGEFLQAPLNKYKYFDGAVLIYAHFPEKLRAEYHNFIAKHIRPGGVILLESFSKGHTKNQEENPSVGGPRNIDMLYTKEMIIDDFKMFTPLEIEEKEIYLSEGIGHNGIAKVIRFIGIKK